MGTFEDALKELRERFDEDDQPAALDVLERYKGSDLRKKAERTDSLETENAELKLKVKRMEMAPKVTKALDKAGVDFEALRPLERQAVEALEYEGDEPSDEWVAKIVADGGFPMREVVEEEEGGEEPPAAKIARQAKGAPAGGGAVGTITPDTVTKWPQDKRLRFRKEQPDAWKKLQQGETVAGVAFS